MMAWIASTSGRTALRVRTMCLLHRGQFLPRLLQRFFNPVWRRPTGNIMAFENRLQRQVFINVRTKSRAELLKLLERHILKLASFFDALLHRMGNGFMRLRKWDIPRDQIGGRRHGIHEASLAGSFHSFTVEFHLTHKTGSNFHATADRGCRVEERLLRLLHIFVVGEWKAFYCSHERHLVADYSSGFSANQFE